MKTALAIFTIIISVCLYSFFTFESYKITFTNGEKVVEHIGMIHIAPKSFYDRVKNYLKTTDATIHLYEGIKVSPDLKNTEQYKNVWNQSSGRGIYRQCAAKQAGWIPQNQFDINQAFSGKNVHADMVITTMDQIKKIGSNRKDFVCKSGLGGLITGLQSMVLTKVITLAAVEGLFSDSDVMPKETANIRNSIVAKKIVESDANKIIITYGLAHWTEFLKHLQKRDPRWKVVSKEEF